MPRFFSNLFIALLIILASPKGHASPALRADAILAEEDQHHLFTHGFDLNVVHSRQFNTIQEFEALIKPLEVGVETFGSARGISVNRSYSIAVSDALSLKLEMADGLCVLSAACDDEEAFLKFDPKRLKLPESINQTFSRVFTAWAEPGWLEEHRDTLMAKGWKILGTFNLPWMQNETALIGVSTGNSFHAIPYKLQEIRIDEDDPLDAEEDITDTHVAFHYLFRLRDHTQDVVGGCILNVFPGKAGNIEGVWLAEEHRGKGLGAILLRSVESFSKNLGLESIYLQTSNLYDTAFAIYKKHGFESTNVLPGIICTDDGKKFDFHYMKKDLVLH
ncbi:MAG: GNAT family N-acetyltransferase [Holosporales bacterium]